ncbi:hypothetical protein ACHAXS_003022, partial [Conticribra weissflogii]
HPLLASLSSFLGDAKRSPEQEERAGRGREDSALETAKAATHRKSSGVKGNGNFEVENSNSDSESKHDEHSDPHRNSQASSSRNGKTNDYEIPLRDEGSHILSPMCGGCHHALRDRRDEHTDCYGFMKRKKNKLKLDSMVDAALVVGGADRDAIAGHVRGNIADHAIEGCDVCNVDRCWMRWLSPDYHRPPNNATNANTKTKTKRKRYLTKYWRYDRTSPKFTNPTTLYLSSIPESLRVPPSRYNDVENYLMEIYNNETIAQPTPSNNHTNHRQEEDMPVPILMEYNPGLAPIPNKMKHPIGTLPPEAAYLVSLRVTPANNCFPREVYKNIPKELNEAIYHTTTNHLGLALLDQDYNMIPGYDAVIDVDVQLGVKRKVRVKEGEVKGLTGEPAFMDYRLFTLGEDVYLHANADLVVVTTLDLATRGSDDASVTDGNEKNYQNNSNKSEDTDDVNSSDSVAEADERGEDDKPFTLKNLYGGDKLQVTLQHPFNTIWSGGSKGKNYALFTIPTNDATKPASDANHSADNSSLPIFAEIEINSPYHKVQQIIPSQYQQISRKITNVRQRRNPRLDPMMKRSMLTVGDVLVSNGTLPLPSFFNVDEVWFPGKFAFKDFNHGGACCISFSADELLGENAIHHKHRDGLSKFPWGNHPSLHVGIAHTHVQWKRWYMDKTKTKEVELLPHTHYVSLIYAFDPYPPFEIRARSGYFCLGFANPVDPANANGSTEPERGTFNPHTPLTRNRKLQQNNETFECPQMQYVSSFIEKVGDPSKTVIGYGLNDCTPRLVEVEKSEIGRLLFPDVWEMVLEEESW